MKSGGQGGIQKLRRQRHGAESAPNQQKPHRTRRIHIAATQDTEENDV